MKTEIQYRKAIGGALLDIRNSLSEDGIKVTQDDVAFQAGISTRYYGAIKRGKILPSVYALEKMPNH
jgi:predicted transcriptional regulator